MKFSTAIALAGAVYATDVAVPTYEAPVETMAQKMEDANSEMALSYNFSYGTTYNYYYGTYYRPTSYTYYSYSSYYPTYYSYSYNTYYRPSSYTYSYAYSYAYTYYSYSYGYHLEGKEQQAAVELNAAPVETVEMAPESQWGTIALLSTAILGSTALMARKCRQSKDSYKSMSSSSVDVGFVSAPWKKFDLCES